MYISPTSDASSAPISRHFVDVIDAITSTSHHKGGSQGGGDGADSQLQRWSSIIGIVTAIVGNILISFALNIQRYAHIKLHQEKTLRKEKSKSPSRDSGYGTLGRNGDDNNRQQSSDGAAGLSNSYQSSNSKSSNRSEDDKDGEGDSSYLKSPYWWGGIVLMTVGEAGNFLAYGFAPASIVSPLGVVALVSNCVIAPFMLKERFRMRDFWGVLVAIGGAVTVVLSAKTEERKLGAHEILDAITTMEFEIYLAVTIALIVALIWASPKYGNRTILIDLGLVGLFGGYTALSTKGVASSLSSSLWKAFSTPVTYVLIAVLVGTAIMQVKYVNKALQRFDSTQVIPVQFVLFTLSVIIGSAVLYRDFQKATPDKMIKFVGGCLLTFFGVWLITSGRPRHDEDDEDYSDEDNEERIGLMGHDDGQEESNGVSKQLDMGMGMDGASDDKDVSKTRRSSHVSFAEDRPRLPRHQSHSSQYPSVRVIPDVSEPTTPKSERGPVLNNPWKTSVDDLLQASRHPGMSATISSPVLPSEAQTSSRESLQPPRTPRSSSHENLSTHPNLQTHPTPPTPDRPKTPRNSISRLLPGPLISPLSSGLSAVVADSLRKGVDVTSRKRSRIGIRRTKSGSQRLLAAGEVTDDEYGSSPLKQTLTAGSSTKSIRNDDSGWFQERSGRGRSLSNTLGDLFRGKRQKLDKDDDDEEIPPSSSNA